MGGRADFNDEEWTEITRLPIAVAALISAVDYSSLSETKELAAFANFIRQAGSRRQRTGIIGDFLDEMADANIDLFQQHCHAVASAMSGDKPVDQALARAKKVGQLVDARMPKAAAKAYKNFVLDVALAVARAHKESMLPFASPVSKIEDFHIRRLEHALGV